MRVDGRERGEGNLGCILWAVIFAVVIYVAWLMVPVRIASAQLGDFMEEQAKFAQRKAPARIKQDILRKAQELNLPLDPKKVSVERKGDYIYMAAEYTVPVEFAGGYTYQWHFEHETNLPIFIF